MDLRAIFGRNMRRYRLDAKLSQEAVGVLMGVDRAHVSAMERGKQNVTLLTIWHASHALKVPAAALLEERVGTSPDTVDNVVRLRAPRRKEKSKG